MLRLTGRKHTSGQKEPASRFQVGGVGDNTPGASTLALSNMQNSAITPGFGGPTLLPLNSAQFGMEPLAPGFQKRLLVWPFTPLTGSKLISTKQFINMVGFPLSCMSAGSNPRHAQDILPGPPSSTGGVLSTPNKNGLGSKLQTEHMFRSFDFLAQKMGLNPVEIPIATTEVHHCVHGTPSGAIPKAMCVRMKCLKIDKMPVRNNSTISFHPHVKYANLTSFCASSSALLLRASPTTSMPVSPFTTLVLSVQKVPVTVFAAIW
mmetsp:Transcript_31888/g.78225  ORF Transcript_31888/g.78225 Transcript_31888/m.78225 type:complete len:263 (+) Transcript_31888:379-1167(+)